MNNRVYVTAQQNLFTWRKIILPEWDLTCVEVRSQLGAMNPFSYMLIDHLSHYCFIYCVVIFISIRISLFLQNQVFLFSLEKLEGDSKSNQGKVDEKNTAEYIDPGNIEPNTEGTVMIVKLHNQMK